VLFYITSIGMETVLKLKYRYWSQWANSPKKQSVGLTFLTIWHCILSAALL